MSNFSIQIQELEMAYQGNVVLESLSVDFPSGEIIGIIGPNGSGKTTLLKGILGLISKEKGTVLFFQQPIEKVRSRIAYVPQRESVDWDFPASVYDVVAMGRLHPTKIWQRTTSQDKSIISDSISKVGLDLFTNRQIGQLSGGQQQRVFLARALAQQADLILMDEPFVGIDMASQESILAVLQELRDAGKTIAMVHHDLSAVATYFDSVLLLNNKKVAFGDTKSILVPEIVSLAYGNSFLFQQKKSV